MDFLWSHNINHCVFTGHVSNPVNGFEALQFEPSDLGFQEANQAFKTFFK